jgi:hypothetical protein
VKPVDQTTFGAPGGNCFSACVASLLELPIEEVPYFMTDEFPGNFTKWLELRGLYFLRFKYVFMPPGFYIMGGLGARGMPHSVVMSGSLLVHDPHPSRAGLVRLEEITVLVPLDPSRKDKGPVGHTCCVLGPCDGRCPTGLRAA